MTSYWNHNTAYHRELVNAVPVRRPAPAAGDALDPNGVNDAASHRGPVTVLDIGCGDGLLVERLLATGATVTGIDADAAAVVQASRRLGLPCRLGAPGPACSTPPGPMSISDPFSGTPADPADASSPLDPVQTDRSFWPPAVGFASSGWRRTRRRWTGSSPRLCSCQSGSPAPYIGNPATSECPRRIPANPSAKSAPPWRAFCPAAGSDAVSTTDTRSLGTNREPNRSRKTDRIHSPPDRREPVRSPIARSGIQSPRPEPGPRPES